MNQLLSMSDTAKLLKIQGYRPYVKTLDLLRAIEEKRSITLLTHLKGRYYTTEAALRSVLPEVFQEDRNTLETIRSLKEAIQTLTSRVNVLSAKVRELTEHDRS